MLIRGWTFKKVIMTFSKYMVHITCLVYWLCQDILVHASAHMAVQNCLFNVGFKINVEQYFKCVKAMHQHNQVYCTAMN